MAGKTYVLLGHYYGDHKALRWSSDPEALKDWVAQDDTREPCDWSQKTDDDGDRYWYCQIKHTGYSIAEVQEV